LHFQKLLVPTKVRTPATLLFCISKNCWPPPKKKIERLLHCCLRFQKLLAPTNLHTFWTWIVKDAHRSAETIKMLWLVPIHIFLLPVK
jgi:hypothetical protein